MDRLSTRCGVLLLLCSALACEARTWGEPDLVRSQGGDGGGAKTDVPHAEVRLEDSAAGVDMAPGSLEACTAQRGPESCCRYDLERTSWVLMDAPCSSACAQDEECPVGWYESRPDAWSGLDDAPCECVSPTAGNCQEGETIWVGPDEECPPDTNRCPRMWPDQGEAECSSCPCQEREYADMPLDGTLYCPPGEDWKGCPCDREYCCGYIIGHGLYCGYDKLWAPFFDCPCWPEGSCGPGWGGWPGECNQPGTY